MTLTNIHRWLDPARRQTLLESQNRGLEVVRASANGSDKTDTTYTPSSPITAKPELASRANISAAITIPKIVILPELPPEERKRYYQQMVRCRPGRASPGDIYQV